MGRLLGHSAVRVEEASTHSDTVWSYSVINAFCVSQEGLELMRHGRAADRADDWGDAYASLSAAAEVFRDAAALDPGSARTLGNWGNALLQLGQVRSTECLAQGST